MDIREHVVALNETRLKVWEEAKGFLERVQKEHPGAEMNAEERTQWDRYNARIDEIDAEVRSFVDRETREQENAALREAQAKVFGEPAAPKARDNEGDVLRSMAKTREGRLEIDIQSARRERELLRQGASPSELRALAWDTGNIASAVPTSMARSLFEVMEAEIAMFRAPTTTINTGAGENIDFPKLTTHSIATQVSGQGTTLAGTDSAYSKVTLGAYKYGELIIVASEVVTDTVFDVASHVGRELGRALGRVIDTDLVVGTGTGKPFGLMAAGGTGSAGTLSTGGSLIDPDYEDLVNLVYSVNDGWRNGGRAGWLLRDSTAGTLRKLRDGAGGTEGSPIWQMSITNGLTGYGQPDFLLNYPVFVDANVASLASNARIIGFGDFSSYYVRTVGNIVIESDASRYFDTDQVGFRGKWRVDGDLLDNTAWNVLKRSV